MAQHDFRFTQLKMETKQKKTTDQEPPPPSSPHTHPYSSGSRICCPVVYFLIITDTFFMHLSIQETQGDRPRRHDKILRQGC